MTFAADEKRHKTSQIMASSAPPPHQVAGRIRKEMEAFERHPPTGISCWLSPGDSLTSMEADIVGPKDTPFEEGVFRLAVSIPDRYPFEPPSVHFKTRIYHPNIDDAGRICLDILRMPPKGAWKPVLNITQVLTSIRLLMAEPNPGDPLVLEIGYEFIRDPDRFDATAREWTRAHAVQK